jgi:tRNA (guanine26-N2/guanine27-N2)-dimethyltransferase
MDDRQCEFLETSPPPTKPNCIIIREGKATIVLSQQNQSVFYNRVQEFNRDLSISVIQIFERIYRREKQELTHQRQLERPGNSHDYREVESYSGLYILEALSATGLRAIRYAKELEGIRKVLANDYSQEAVHTIEKNILDNGLSFDKVQPHHGDAK